VPRGVRAGTDAGRTRAAEGNGRRPIVCNRNRTDPISGCAKNGDAPGDRIQADCGTRLADRIDGRLSFGASHVIDLGPAMAGRRVI